jgi:hypothetical protein
VIVGAVVGGLIASLISDGATVLVGAGFGVATGAVLVGLLPIRLFGRDVLDDPEGSSVVGTPSRERCRVEQRTNGIPSQGSPAPNSSGHQEIPAAETEHRSPVASARGNA